MPALRDMLDAYVLSAVFSYSAIHAIYPRSRIILSALASFVLLLNSHYLHAPIHVLSTVLALLVLLIPFSPEHFSSLTAHGAHILRILPHFTLELIIGFMLLSWLIRAAFVKPWRRAVQQRRQAVPIKPAPQQPRIVSEDVVRENARQVLTGPDPEVPEAPEVVQVPQDEPVVEDDEIQPELPSNALQPEQDGNSSAGATGATPRVVSQEEVVRLAREMLATRLRASDQANEVAKEKRSALTPKETFSSVEGPRRRRITKSHELAAKIMAERAEEQAKKEAIRLAAEIAYEAEKMSRMEKMRKREEMKEELRQAEEEEKAAREELGEIVKEADRAREWRRRAIDQARLGGFEGEVEQAGERVKEVEKREIEVLRKVTKCRGKIVGLREKIEREE